MIPRLNAVALSLPLLALLLLLLHPFQLLRHYSHKTINNSPPTTTSPTSPLLDLFLLLLL